MLNSLEVEYFKCGTTVLNEKTRSQYFKHTHSQPFALITQITKGELLIRIHGTDYRIKPGEALIVPGHVQYKLTLLDEEAFTNWINLDYTLFDHFSIFDFIEAPVTAPLPAGNTIGRIQAELLELMQTTLPNPGAALDASVKIKQRLFALLEMILSLSRYKHGSIEKMTAMKRFSPIFSYIEEHLAEKIKVSHLAKLMYLSTSHFHKEFHGAFEMSPMQYIHGQRLKKAQLLLTTSTTTVREIAGKVGYENDFAFIRFFKSMVGQSPGQYRKSIWNDLNIGAVGKENGKAD